MKQPVQNYVPINKKMGVAGYVMAVVANGFQAAMLVLLVVSFGGGLHCTAHLPMHLRVNIGSYLLQLSRAQLLGWLNGKQQQQQRQLIKSPTFISSI